MAIEGRQLAQTRRTATGSATAYTPDSNIKARVTNIVIVNNDTTVHDAYIYHDKDGTTYDATTRIFSLPDIPAGGMIEVAEQNIHVDGNLSGNVGVEVPTATPDVTFTFYGEEDLREG